MKKGSRKLLAGLPLALGMMGLAGVAIGDCQDTGFQDLTAKVVNEDVIDDEIDIGDCDVGAFFSIDGIVEGASFNQPDTNPEPSVQYGVLVVGASVDMNDASIWVVPDYNHQFIHIGYRDGATGVIDGNLLTGFKRVGILLDGEGTSGVVRENTLVGVGKKTTGWAENGIQVSRGASATVRSNTVEGHYWGLNNFASAGIIVFDSNDVVIQRNEITGGDLAIALIGDRNNAIHNFIETSNDDDTTIYNDGISIFGTDNGARQNTITNLREGNDDIGIIVQGFNTKLIRNTFEGEDFGYFFIWDLGEDTKLPAPFVP